MANVQLWRPRIGLGGTILVLLIRAPWRFFFTGQPMFSAPKSNATLFHEATTDFRNSPVEKLPGPLWRMIVWRWIFIGLPLAFLMMGFVSGVVVEIYRGMEPPRIAPVWSSWPWVWTAAGWEITAGLLVLSVYGNHLVHLLQTRHTTNEFVYPAWQAACGVLGIPYHRRDARRMIILPDNFEPTEDTFEPDVSNPILVWLLSRQWIFNRVSWWLDQQRETERLAIEAEAAAELDDDDESEPVNPSTEIVPKGEWAVAPFQSRATARGLVIDEPPEEQPVRLYLPIGKIGTEAEKKRLVTAVSNVLGMPDPRARWDLIGRQPYVDMTPNHPPPRVVTFADIKRHVLAADIDHPVVGLAHGNRPETLDYVDESPHILISGGTGTGKSTLQKLFLCQRMHHGAALMIFDFKMVSHRWAHDLPGCRYSWRIADIHEGLVDLGLEVQRRKENAIPEGAGPDDPLTEFGTLDVVLEEMNSLSDDLRRYWMEIKGQGDPPQSPAIQAVRDAINMGREFKIFVHVASQRASASIFGPNGGDARESFSTRLLAAWTMQTWKMLVGNGVPFQRFPSGPRGIWGRVQGGELHVFRVPRLTNTEAREWALGGVPSPGQPGFTGVGPAGPDIVDGVEITPVGQVTLLQAIEPGVLPGIPLTIAAIRQATKRPGFPSAVGREGKSITYPLDKLIEWKRTRDGRVNPDELETESTRRGIVYQFTVRDVYDGSPRIGYIGQTFRTAELREEEHRGGRPWADLILNDAEIIWEKENCTPEELDAMEQHFIRERKPLYNIEFQKGAPWAVPLWDQISQRQERQKVAGLPEWTPRDVYSERNG